MIEEYLNPHSLYANRYRDIKSYRQKTGASLKEAANHVDEIIYWNAYKTIGMVETVKFYRQNKAADLKTAVDYMKSLNAGRENKVPEYPVLIVGDFVRVYDFVGDVNSYIEGAVIRINGEYNILKVSAVSKTINGKTRRINAEYTVLNNGFDPEDRNNFIRIQKVS